MIRMPKVPEPVDFDIRARQPGNTWLAENPTAKRPSPLWTPYKPQLEAGYGRLCGYAAMLDPTGGTVDHYLSFKNNRALAYEWSNYRFASATMNSRKGAQDDRVLDPEQVQAGWFEVLLPSLQMRLTDHVPASQRAKAEHTLSRLGLANGESVIRWRRSWYELFERGELTLDGLRRVAPLIAEAVDRGAPP